MLSRIGFTLVAVAMSVGSFGCQNKVAKERDELYIQNREQQAKIDALLESQRSQPAPQVMQQQPQPPAPVATPVAPPAAPRATPTIEGAEMTTDVAAGTMTVNIASDVLFESGKADLKPNAKKTLDQVAGVLNDQYNGKKLRVEGHTDSDPIRVSKWKSNQELSVARAKAVKDYLVTKGVNTSRITTSGFGSDKPRGQMKSSNRRVEIVVITK